jgi:hypothetical protein
MSSPTGRPRCVRVGGPPGTTPMLVSQGQARELDFSSVMRCRATLRCHTDRVNWLEVSRNAALLVRGCHCTFGRALAVVRYIAASGCLRENG